MRLLQILPLAGLATAIVLPEEQVMAEIAIEDHHKNSQPALKDNAADFLDDLKHIVDGVKGKVDDVFENSKNYLDDAIAYATDAGHKVSEKINSVGYDIDAWLEDADYHVDPREFIFGPDGPHHGKPPKDGPPKDGPPEHPHPPHHRPPPGDHHPPHHKHPKANQTIYQLISKSKYTTKLAKLIDEDKDLVKILNGTAANYTIFAPTDAAFEKIPEHAPKPSPEFLKALLLYHITPHFYPAGRLAFTHTIPSLLNSSALGDKPQRLTARLGLKGLTINFYSRVVAANIFASNGIIHGVDSIIIPPPSVLKIVELFPSEFSTLELGLIKTGLLESLSELPHKGLTFFAPSNFAFKKLGPKINAFLFSKYGEKYLKALLQYHVVANQTLYSDAFYNSQGSADQEIVEMGMRHRGCNKGHHDEGRSKRERPEAVRQARGPRDYYHFDLPTLLEDKPVAIDIARFGPIIKINVNHRSVVVVQDGVARDGVIQVISDVLIPPRKPREDSQGSQDAEMSVEEFKQRLAPLLEGEQQGEGDWMEL